MSAKVAAAKRIKAKEGDAPRMLDANACSPLEEPFTCRLLPCRASPPRRRALCSPELARCRQRTAEQIRTTRQLLCTSATSRCEHPFLLELQGPEPQPFKSRTQGRAGGASATVPSLLCQTGLGQSPGQSAALLSFASTTSPSQELSPLCFPFGTRSGTWRGRLLPSATSSF